MWYRVFGRNESPPPPAALLSHLQGCGLAVEARFRGDDLGWTAAELRVGVGGPVFVERYLTTEDDLRDDLNSWAAFLETCDYSPNHAMLMERVVQSAQLITLRRPIDHADEVRLEQLCDAACRHLAAATDGVYQIDGQGWFAADGTLLLQEY
jgi:hypothetical protein